MRPVDFKELAGTTKLFLDFVGRRKPACDFYGHDFMQTTSYERTAREIDEKDYPRDELVSILTKAAASLELSAQVRKNIERLGQENSLVVFAGQQVGLLLGPMYTIYKALTAHKLAQKLESRLGRPVIPCFWMATDDHDFDEVKTVYLLGRAGQLIAITYEPIQRLDGLPMAALFLDSGIERFVSQVEENLIVTEFSERVVDLVRSLYSPGRLLAEAFTSLFDKLLGELGIVPIDPNYAGMKRLMAPVLRREVEQHNEIFEIHEARTVEVVKAGYHRQVHKTQSSLNLFFNDGRRRHIIVGDGQYTLDGRQGSFSKKELLGLLDQSPERFSPNVCLRPVAQCFAFPTISHIVGPSESAYFAQILPLFDFFGVPCPVIRPRVFASLVEPQIARILRKLSIDFVSLYNHPEHEVGRVIKENFPPDIQQKAESMGADFDASLQRLADSLQASDPESFQAIEHHRRRINHEINHLSRRLFAAHKKRHDTAIGQVQRAAAFLFPNGRFQERTLSPIYFANKFGPAIFGRIERQLDIDILAHQVIEVAP